MLPVLVRSSMRLSQELSNLISLLRSPDGVRTSAELQCRTTSHLGPQTQSPQYLIPPQSLFISIILVVINTLEFSQTL